MDYPTVANSRGRTLFESLAYCPAAANRIDQAADAEPCGRPFGSRRQSEKAKPKRTVPPKKGSQTHRLPFLAESKRLQWAKCRQIASIRALKKTVVSITYFFGTVGPTGRGDSGYQIKILFAPKNTRDCHPAALIHQPLKLPDGRFQNRVRQQTIKTICPETIFPADDCAVTPVH